MASPCTAKGRVSAAGTVSSNALLAISPKPAAAYQKRQLTAPSHACADAVLNHTPKY